MRLALLSSAAPMYDPKISSVIKQAVKVLRDQNIELVTGGSSGIPALAIEEMHHLGGATTVFSPDTDPASHMQRVDNLPLGVADQYFYGQGFSSRSVAMIKYVDGAIVLNGRIGTLSEFTIALEERLPVLVVEGTGGISDHLNHILKIANKEFPDNLIIFTKETEKGLLSLINFIRFRQHQTNPKP